MTTDNAFREKKEKNNTVREKIEKIEEKENSPRKISRKFAKKIISEKKIPKNLTIRQASTTPSKVFKRGSERKNPKNLIQTPMSTEKRKLILRAFDENRAGRSSPENQKLANTNLLPLVVEPQLNHSLCSRSAAYPRENRDQWGEAQGILTRPAEWPSLIGGEGRVSDKTVQ